MMSWPDDFRESPFVWRAVREPPHIGLRINTAYGPFKAQHHGQRIPARVTKAKNRRRAVDLAPGHLRGHRGEPSKKEGCAG